MCALVTGVQTCALPIYEAAAVVAVVDEGKVDAGVLVELPEPFVDGFHRGARAPQFSVAMLGLDPSIHGSAFSPLRHGPPGQDRGRQSAFGPLPPAQRGERDQPNARSTGSRPKANRASSGRRRSEEHTSEL